MSVMLLLTLITALFPATLAVKCYVCSWSPKDAPNRTMMCHDDHFEGNAVAIAEECDNGCQTYLHMDSNGAVEQLRRSCLQTEEEMTGSCVSEVNKAFSSKRCTCNYNLCNTAPPLLFPAIFLLAAMFVIHLFHFI